MTRIRKSFGIPQYVLIFPDVQVPGMEIICVGLFDSRFDAHQHAAQHPALGRAACLPIIDPSEPYEARWRATNQVQEGDSSPPQKE